MIIRSRMPYLHKGMEPLYIHTINDSMNIEPFEYHYSDDIAGYDGIKRLIDATLSDYLQKHEIVEHNVVLVVPHFYVGKYTVVKNTNPATLVLHIRI